LSKGEKIVPMKVRDAIKSPDWTGWMGLGPPNRKPSPVPSPDQARGSDNRR